MKQFIFRTSFVIVVFLVLAALFLRFPPIVER